MDRGEIRVERTVDGRRRIRIRYTRASGCNRRLIDIEAKELLAIWASYRRSSFAAFVFNVCTNKPVILVDGS